MKKALQNAVYFARFCAEHGADPATVAALRHAVDMSANAYAQDRDNPRQRIRYEREHDRANEIAAGLGWRIDWPGLFPTFTRDGYRGDFMLPEV